MLDWVLEYFAQLRIVLYSEFILACSTIVLDISVLVTTAKSGYQMVGRIMEESNCSVVSTQRIAR